MLLFHICGLTNEYSGEAEFLRAGRLVRVPTLTEIEDATIFGVGRLEAAVTSGGTSLAPETFRGRLDVYDYKTLRYRGHFAKVAAMRDLGLFELDRVRVEGGRVRPRDVFEAVAASRLSFPKDKDLVVLRVEASSGGSGPRAKKRVVTLVDRFNPATGFTAMERTTAFPAAAMLHLQVKGLIAPGATTPERGVPFDAYVAAVKARGLKLRMT
jgi:lysine 6-dehydrogenase